MIKEYRKNIGTESKDSVPIALCCAPPSRVTMVRKPCFARWGPISCFTAPNVLFPCRDKSIERERGRSANRIRIVQTPISICRFFSQSSRTKQDLLFLSREIKSKQKESNSKKHLKLKIACCSIFFCLLFFFKSLQSHLDLRHTCL